MSIEETSDIYLTKVKEILDLPVDFRFIKGNQHTKIDKLSDLQREQLERLIEESKLVIPNPKWLECVLDVYFDIKVEYIIHIVQ